MSVMELWWKWIDFHRRKFFTLTYCGEFNKDFMLDYQTLLSIPTQI